MRAYIRGAVLEGMGHAGKTSILRALKQEQAKDIEDERSVVILGEHYSQALQTVSGELKLLDQQENQFLLDERVTTLEKLNDWAAYLGPPARKRSRGLFFAFERFHLGHRVGYPGYDTDFLSTLEQRLCDLNTVCFLMTVSPETIPERIAHRASRGGRVYEPAELTKECEAWIRKQDGYLLAAESSAVPTVVVNTDERNWPSYAREIRDRTDIPVS